MARKKPDKKKKASKKRLKVAKPKARLRNLTPKRQKVVYRDRKGRIVKPEDIKGRKLIRWEIWRYSPNTKRWKKLEFGKRWESKLVKRKRPLSKKEFLLILKRRYLAHKIQVKEVNGEIFALTGSP